MDKNLENLFTTKTLHSDLSRASYSTWSAIGRPVRTGVSKFLLYLDLLRVTLPLATDVHLADFLERWKLTASHERIIENSIRQSAQRLRDLGRNELQLISPEIPRATPRKDQYAAMLPDLRQDFDLILKACTDPCSQEARRIRRDDASIAEISLIHSRAFPAGYSPPKAYPPSAVIALKNLLLRAINVVEESGMTVSRVMDIFSETAVDVIKANPLFGSGRPNESFGKLIERGLTFCIWMRRDADAARLQKMVRPGRGVPKLRPRERMTDQHFDRLVEFTPEHLNMIVAWTSQTMNEFAEGKRRIHDFRTALVVRMLLACPMSQPELLSATFTGPIREHDPLKRPMLVTSKVNIEVECSPTTVQLIDDSWSVLARHHLDKTMRLWPVSRDLSQGNVVTTALRKVGEKLDLPFPLTVKLLAEITLAHMIRRGDATLEVLADAHRSSQIINTKSRFRRIIDHVADLRVNEISDAHPPLGLDFQFLDEACGNDC